MKARLLAIGIAVVVSLTACGGDDPDPPAASGDTAGTDDRVGVRGDVTRYGADGVVTFKLAGSHNADYDGPSHVGLLRAKVGTARVLTVGWSSPIEADGWTVHEAYVTIEGFEKDGSFKIQPKAPGGQTSALTNNVSMVVYRKGPDGKPVDAARYEFPVKGCDVVIKRLGDEGSVKCPEFADSNGKSVSFEATWKMTGPKQDEHNVTTTTSVLVAP